MIQKRLINLIYRSSVRNLKLVISFIFYVIHMASDSCTYAS